MTLFTRNLLWAKSKSHKTSYLNRSSRSKFAPEKQKPQSWLCGSPGGFHSETNSPPVNRLKPKIKVTSAAEHF
jgi:hypothetical protein